MNQEILLGVNIDHVATLRQARLASYPDPVQAGMDAEQAGADCITLHLREDRRHIQERDVEMLREMLQTRMNLEMAVTEEMIAFAERIRPHNICLVPERREELTTEGGLDVLGQEERIRDACRRLAAAGCEVSLFIDAESAQIEAAARVGAPAVEIHTGHFADAWDTPRMEERLEAVRRAVVQGSASACRSMPGTDSTTITSRRSPPSPACVSSTSATASLPVPSSPASPNRCAR